MSAARKFCGTTPQERADRAEAIVREAVATGFPLVHGKYILRHSKVSIGLCGCAIGTLAIATGKEVPPAGFVAVARASVVDHLLSIGLTREEVDAFETGFEDFPLHHLGWYGANGTSNKIVSTNDPFYLAGQRLSSLGVQVEYGPERP